MLVWRLFLGTLLIAGLAVLCWLDYAAARAGTYLLPLAIALSLLGGSELVAMFRKRGYEPLAWAIYCGIVVTLVLSPGMPAMTRSGAAQDAVGRLGWLAIGLMLSLLIAVVGELYRFRSAHANSSPQPTAASRSPTLGLALSMLAILYAGGLMGFLVQLRLLSGGPWGYDGRWGMVALISLIATVKASDIGQYTCGRLIGRRKLAPAISPGKTWEGAAGGILCAIAAAWIVFTWGARIAAPAAPAAADMTISTSRAVTIVFFAVAVAVAGMVGDLSESMLKRDAGVKDSSTWMPGFGGVLDLLDSLWGAAPMAYLFWVTGLVGP